MQPHGFFDNPEYRILALVCSVSALAIPSYELGNMTKGFAAIATLVLLWSLGRYWRGENRVPRPVIAWVSDKAHFGTFSTVLDHGQVKVFVTAEDGTVATTTCNKHAVYASAEDCLKQIIEAKP